MLTLPTLTLYNHVCFSSQISSYINYYFLKRRVFSSALIKLSNRVNLQQGHHTNHSIISIQRYENVFSKNVNKIQYIQIIYIVNKYIYTNNVHCIHNHTHTYTHLHTPTHTHTQVYVTTITIFRSRVGNIVTMLYKHCCNTTINLPAVETGKFSVKQPRPGNG